MKRAWGGHLLQALFRSTHEAVSISQKGQQRPRGRKEPKVTQQVGGGQNPASGDGSSLRGLLWGVRLPEPLRQPSGTPQERSTLQFQVCCRSPILSRCSLLHSQAGYWMRGDRAQGTKESDNRLTAFSRGGVLLCSHPGQRLVPRDTGAHCSPYRHRAALVP